MLLVSYLALADTTREAQLPGLHRPPQLANSDSPLVVTQRAATLKLVAPTLPQATLTHETKPTQISFVASMKTSMITPDPAEAVSIIRAMTVSGRDSGIEKPAALFILG